MMTPVLWKRRAAVWQDCRVLLCYLGYPVFLLWLHVKQLRSTRSVPSRCLRDVRVKTETGQEWIQPSGCWCDGKQTIVYSCQWWINDRPQHWGQGLKAWCIWGKKGGADAPWGQRADRQTLGGTLKRGDGASATIGGENVAKTGRNNGYLCH